VVVQGLLRRPCGSCGRRSLLFNSHNAVPLRVEVGQDNNGFDVWARGDTWLCAFRDLAG
jgi:hypothetical protein